MKTANLPGLLASLPHLGKDEAEAFRADLARARQSLADAELRDLWILIDSIREELHGRHTLDGQRSEDSG